MLLQAIMLFICVEIQYVINIINLPLLKILITRYCQNHNLSQNINYAVSIPASFEANQRKDLMARRHFKAISDNGYIYDVAKDYKSLYDIVTKQFYLYNFGRKLRYFASFRPRLKKNLLLYSLVLPLIRNTLPIYLAFLCTSPYIPIVGIV